LDEAYFGRFGDFCNTARITMSTFHQYAVELLLSLMVVAHMVTFSVWLYCETVERVKYLLTKRK
jgi:hypothetical protein